MIYVFYLYKISIINKYTYIYIYIIINSIIKPHLIYLLSSIYNKMSLSNA